MKESSAILIDGVQTASLQRCPHCQGHFAVAKQGSFEMAKQSALSDIAAPRVFCMKCGKLTCGRPQCNPAIACVPFEAKVEMVEGKLTGYEDEMELLRDRGLLQFALVPAADRRR